MRSDVFVVNAPIAEGELFAIFRSEEMLGSYMWSKSKSLEELRAGTLGSQKVYVLRCGHCGHEYEADGCEVHSHRCPRCQSA